MTMTQRTRHAESSKPKLNRATLATSRLMDFCSEKELTAQTGHARTDWPLVILKELMIYFMKRHLMRQVRRIQQVKQVLII